MPTDEFSLSNAERAALKDAISHDIFELELLRFAMPSSVWDRAIASASTEAVALCWMGSWAAAIQTPPSYAQYTANGAVRAKDRYWITQELLNRNPDIKLDDLSVMDSPAMDRIFAEREYRIYSRFQVCLLVDEIGRIKSVNGVPPTRASVGLTKIVPGFNKGDIISVQGFEFPVSNVQLGRFTMDAEASPYHGSRFTAGDKQSVALYASARIGIEGRKGNWRLMGKDVPWIFVESVFRREGLFPWYTAKPRASIDVTFGMDESKPFNDLSFFVRDYSREGFPFIRKRYLPMNGHGDDFLEIGSSTWPTPPSEPLTQPYPQ